LLNCVLTLFFWIPGVIHALAEVNSAQNARNTNKIVEELRRQGRR
jgi:Proteolipid membrane potential modulator